MTEPEAWREIARRIVEREWDEYGLCREAWVLVISYCIDRSTFYSMTDRVKAHMGSGGFAYETGTEPEARALAALWLALEAEEEAA